MTGTFVGVDFDDATVDALSALQREIGVPNPTMPHDFHCTVVASRTPIEWTPISTRTSAVPIGWEMFDHGEQKALVLLLANEHLTGRHYEARMLGATWDFDEYRPHVTLSYDAADFDHTALPIPEIELGINGEFMKDFNKDWTPDTP